MGLNAIGFAMEDSLQRDEKLDCTGGNLNELVAGSCARQMIVRTRPFALDLEARLRSPLPVAEVSARQRIVALFRQQRHAPRSLLERRRVGIAIGEAAGQSVHRLFYRVQRHIELLATNAIRHQHLYSYLA